MKMTYFAAIALATTIAGTNSYAQDWGDLKMTLVYDGTPPEPKKIDTSKDPQCGGVTMDSEELLVNPVSKGIANIVLTLDVKKSKLDDSKIHPDMKAAKQDKLLLDNNKCKFVPHVFAFRAGNVLEVKNSDNAGHNAKFNFFNQDEANFVVAPNSSKDFEIKKDEATPIPIECNIHPWMKSYIVITSHPYVGISDAEGQLVIPKLPTGTELTFKIWHENQNKSIEEVNVGGKAETWKKGVLTLTIKPGENNLGKVLLKPDRFKK